MIMKRVGIFHGHRATPPCTSFHYRRLMNFHVGGKGGGTRPRSQLH